jgi:hypothetical protein
MYEDNRSREEEDVDQVVYGCTTGNNLGIVGV